MAPLIEIERADDDRLADYVRLRDSSLRRRLETAHGLFIAEGEKVIRRAAEAGYQPRSFLLATRWLAGLADVLDRWPEVATYVVDEALAEEVTGFHVHRGALASFERQQRFGVDDLLGLNRLVVLEDIVDHTNVGAILRNAAGLGWDGALLAPRTADPLYRRAIKVSAGTVFSLPWARLPDWYAAPGLLAEAGFLTVALTLSPGAVDLETVRQELAESTGPLRKVAILVGTEGAGLSSHWTDAAEKRAIIPMRAGVDSLNVAAATAVACYALSSSSSSRSSRS